MKQESKLGVYTPSEMDWARLAAYIDGEGHVGINQQRFKNPKRSRRHYLAVVVTNTDPRLMLWLKRTFGGSIYEVSVKSRRRVFRWQLNARKGVEVLKGCLPYFIIKKELAELGIAFQDAKSKRRLNTRQLTTEELRNRDEFASKMRDINSGRNSRGSLSDTIH